MYNGTLNDNTDPRSLNRAARQAGLCLIAVGNDLRVIGHHKRHQADPALLDALFVAREPLLESLLRLGGSNQSSVARTQELLSDLHQRVGQVRRIVDEGLTENRIQDDLWERMQSLLDGMDSMCRDLGGMASEYGL